jgi:type IV fimbrial biogenesis protein FimT
MKKHGGFTLIELMVTVAILAILLGIAAPSFESVIKSSRMASAVNTFMSDMRFARSEAIRRGGGVVMCRSDAPENATPSCGSGSGPGGNGWVSGWIIFHDLNNDTDYDSGETLLRVQSKVTSVDSIVQNTSKKFQFTGTGRLPYFGSSTTFQFGSSPSFSNTQQRVLCVNVAGRARIAGDGYVSCD